MINFTTVRYKNLLSSGNNFTEIVLDSHQTTLVLGENGSGKSTLLDALCFGLYGKGFRNLKKDLLVNSINGKGLEVEVEFNVGKKQYKVLRGAKPNKFELYVNDKLVNQDANVRDYQEHLEKNILKMNYRSFTQVAILGSANFTPFMQLKSVERRKLVEDLLDITIFSTMSDILRKKLSNHVVDVRENDHEIDLLEERINGLNEQLNALRENRDKRIKQYEGTVEETQTNINNLMETINEKTKNVVEKTSTIEDQVSAKDKLQQATELERKLNENYKKAIKEIKFYEALVLSVVFLVSMVILYFAFKLFRKLNQGTSFLDWRKDPLEFQVDEEITAKRVKLVGEDKHSYGTVSLAVAMKIAEDKELNLIQYGKGKVPICRLGDYERLLDE